MTERRSDLRNIAIIAHVDHGKTTLVDAMLRQTGVFHEKAALTDRVLDSNDLERERGITILAKQASVRYRGTKINIIDTPGHADFGGEVERTLRMADGALLLVDAAEGPLPQTRFVLGKAIELGMPILVVINKIDRPDGRPDEVLNEVFDLFCELEASDDAGRLRDPLRDRQGRGSQARARGRGRGSDAALRDDPGAGAEPPGADRGAPLSMLVNNIQHDEYVGRLAIGRIVAGRLAAGTTVALMGIEGTKRAKVGNVYGFEAMKRVEVDDASRRRHRAAFAGIEDVQIGDTSGRSRERPSRCPASTSRSRPSRSRSTSTPRHGRQERQVGDLAAHARTGSSARPSATWPCASRTPSSPTVHRLRSRRADDRHPRSRPCAARATSSPSACPRWSSARIDGVKKRALRARRHRRARGVRGRRHPGARRAARPDDRRWSTSASAGPASSSGCPRAG